MSDSNRTAVAINASAIVAMVAGITGFVLLLQTTGGVRITAMASASIAILLGAVSTVHARRRGSSSAWLGIVAAAMGVVVYVIVVLS